MTRIKELKTDMTELLRGLEQPKNILPYRRVISVRHADPKSPRYPGDQGYGITQEGIKQCARFGQTLQLDLWDRAAEGEYFLAVADSGLKRSVQTGLVIYAMAMQVKRLFKLDSLHVLHLGSVPDLQPKGTLSPIAQNAKISDKQEILRAFLTNSSEENKALGARTTEEVAVQMMNTFRQLMIKVSTRFDPKVSGDIIVVNHEANMGALIKEFNLADPADLHINPTETLELNFPQRRSGNNSRGGLHFRDSYVDLVLN